MNKLGFQCLKLQIKNDIYMFEEQVQKLNKGEEGVNRDLINRYQAKIDYAGDILREIKNIEDLSKEE